MKRVSLRDIVFFTLYVILNLITKYLYVSEIINMKKNKIIAALVIIMTITAMTACGEQNTGSTPETSVETTTAAQTTAAETTASAPETTVKETTVTEASSEVSSETTAETASEKTASAKDVAGVWYEDTLDPRLLTINEDGTFTLEYAGGGIRYGTVKIDYEGFGDGSKRPWYQLCEDDGTVWLSFAGDMDGEQLNEIWGIPENEDEVHFTRDIAVHDEGMNAPEPNEYGYYPVDDTVETNISIDDLEGEWYCSEEDEYIVFTHAHNNGRYIRDFVITHADKTIDEGTVSLEYSLNPDGEKEFWYNLYFYDGKFVMGFSTGDNTHVDDLYAGQSGEPHFVRESNGVFSGSDAEDYLGVWACGRITADIEEEDGSYLVNIHWSSSAAEGTVWEYKCSYDADRGILRCDGNGVCTDYIFDEDGNETSTTVYTDGTATFEIGDGVLYWNDEKEDMCNELELMR